MTITLGFHWDTFIAERVASGRYGSTEEVLRTALRELEERERAFDAFRAHVAEGVEQADRGEFVETFSIADVIARAKSGG